MRFECQGCLRRWWRPGLSQGIIKSYLEQMPDEMKAFVHGQLYHLYDRPGKSSPFFLFSKLQLFPTYLIYLFIFSVGDLLRSHQGFLCHLLADVHLPGLWIRLLLPSLCFQVSLEISMTTFHPREESHSFPTPVSLWTGAKGNFHLTSLEGKV